MKSKGNFELLWLLIKLFHIKWLNNNLNVPKHSQMRQINVCQVILDRHYLRL